MGRGLRQVACFTLLLAVATAQAQVVKETDRFTGATSLKYKRELDGRAHKYQLSQPKFFATATFADGEEPVYSTMIYTSASSSARGGGGWRYLRQDRIYWLADGVPVETQKPIVQRDVGRGFVVEAFIQIMTREEMAKLGSATAVEFRIGRDEFALSAADIAALKSLSESPP